GRRYNPAPCSVNSAGQSTTVAPKVGYSRRTVLGARFSRKSSSRRLASGSPWAIAAISDSMSRAAGAAQLGVAREDMHGGEVGHRGVAGNAFGKLDRPCKPGARFDEVVGKSERSALFGPVGPPGQHHVDDAGGADQPRQAH